MYTDHALLLYVVLYICTVIDVIQDTKSMVVTSFGRHSLTVFDIRLISNTVGWLNDKVYSIGETLK